MIYSFSEKPWT